MDFKVLGPVSAHARGEPVSLGGAKPRALVAALLSQPGKVVQPDRLSDAIWGENPPASARGLLHTYVSGLRRRFAETGQHNPLTRVGSGYRLEVTAEQLDATRFEQLVEQARAHVAGHNPMLARQVYAEALDLWDGPAFGGLSNGCLQPEAQRLEELRLTALEERISADLACGHDASLVPELRTLVHDYPLREQLWAALMIALCRQGRRGEALSTFQSADRLLRNELGIEPGDELRELQHAMLHDERAITHGTSAPDTPINQLPATCRKLIGRTEPARRAVDSLRPAEGATTPAITVLSGAPGVGKTALAVEAAQRLKPEFPDGVLYADMHGYRDAQRTAGEVLPGFLRALGVSAEQLPSDVEVLSALFRDRVECRGLLIVLDDVCSADQARALLPGTPSCSVLVVTRNALTGLVASHGAHRLQLDLLEPTEARELVTHSAGDPDEAAEVARLCGYLPLAIRTATARAKSGLARQLAGPERLEALEIDGDEPSGVRASFERSYRVLDTETQRVFCQLPLLAEQPFDAASVAPVTGQSAAQVRRSLAVLAAENLLREVPGGYSVDELLLLYAESLGTKTSEFQDGTRLVRARTRTRPGRTRPAKPRPARRGVDQMHRADQPGVVIPTARSPDGDSA